MSATADTPVVPRKGLRSRSLPPTLLIGVGMLVVYAIVAVSGPLWIPYDPYETNLTPPFAPMSGEHWLGTDVLGRDVFSRVVEGARYDMFLALTSTTIAVLAGAAIGLASGYAGGWIDELLMRVFEGVISIPLLILALLAIAAAGPDLSGNAILLIGVVVLVYMPRTARVARGAAVDLVTRDYVAAARARGESVSSIVRRELAPNAAGVLLVEFGARAGYAPILIGSLGFLGFGARPPSAEWGLMIAENRQAIEFAPASVLGPAVALAGLVIGLNLFADGVARHLGRSTARTP